MANTTYQVTLSTDGAHTVTVTSNEPATMKTAVLWAKATYAALVELYGTTAEPSEPAAASTEVAPICAVHDIPMVQVQGKRGPFWSCHERDDNGSFCSYRPKNGA